MIFCVLGLYCGRISTDHHGLCTHIRISWVSEFYIQWTLLFFSLQPSVLPGRKEFLWKEGEFSSFRYRHRQRYRHRSTIKRCVKTCQLSAYQPAYGGKGGEIFRKRMKEKDRQKEHLLSIACWDVTTDFICWPRELKMSPSFALSAESANEIKPISLEDAEFENQFCLLVLKVLGRNRP